MSRISDIIFAGAPHRITSPFGARGSGFHSGCDYGTYLVSLPQYAVEEGEVLAKGFEPAGAGYYVWISYPALGKKFIHCHLRETSPLKVGDRVRRGTLVGYTGSTGNSTGIHLHLGIKDLVSGKYEDPEIFSEKYENELEVKPLSEQPIRLKIGFASEGDTKRIKGLFADLKIDSDERDGFLFTEIAVSAGDQIEIARLCRQLTVPLCEYTEADGEPQAVVKRLKALLREINELIDELKEK